MELFKRFIWTLLWTIPAIFIGAGLGVMALWWINFFNPFDKDTDLGSVISEKIKKFFNN